MFTRPSRLMISQILLPDRSGVRLRRGSKGGFAITAAKRKEMIVRDFISIAVACFDDTVS